MAGLTMVAWWVLAHVVPAMAADPVALPASESEEEWRAALQLADLEPGGAESRIRIVASPRGIWFIECVADDGSVRRVRVQRPRNANDREEIAFLARGVARESSPAPTPFVHQAPKLPPPPPPPTVAAGRAPPEGQPDERDAAADQMIQQSLDELVPPRSSLGPPRVREPSQVPPSVEAVEYWSSGRRTGVAPFDIRLGMASRPGIQTGAVFGLGLPLYTGKVTNVRLAWQTHTSRDLSLTLDRRMVTADLELEATARVLRPVQIGVATALSYRTFRQQGQPLMRGVLPVVSPRLLVTALPGRRMAIDAWADFGLDLGRFQLVREDGSIEYLPPYEFGAGLRFRFRGSGDLNDPYPTPKKR